MLISACEKVVKVFSHSVLSNSATPWTAAQQAPLSIGVSRQEYWSMLPFPSPGSYVSIELLFFAAPFIWSNLTLPPLLLDFPSHLQFHLQIDLSSLGTILIFFLSFIYQILLLIALLSLLNYLFILLELHMFFSLI